MSSPQRITNSIFRFWQNPRFWLKVVPVVILAGVAAFAAGAGPSIAPPPEVVTDDKLAVRIHAAIANDPDLKKHHLNLLVNVVDRTAVIGGPLPDMSLAPKIEEVAKSVSGIRDVKVSAWVPSVASGDPFARKVAEQMKGDKPKTPKPPEPPTTPTVPDPLPLLTLPKAEEKRPDPTPKAAPTSLPTTPTVVRSQPGVLQEPVPPNSPEKPAPTRVPPTPPGAAPLPYKTIPPTRLPTTPESPSGLPEAPSPQPESNPLAKEIEALKKRSLAFADLNVELRGKVAIISGKAKTDEAAWDLAAQIRLIDGIERVIIGKVTTR